MKCQNFGIIGCSSIAKRNSIPAMISSNRINLVRIGSRSITKAKRVAEENDCDYGNYNDIVEDEKIDVVYISLPIALQKEWIIKSLMAGKHVICEKSAVTSYKDAKKIVDIAQEKNLKILENFAFKNHPQHKFVLENLKKLGNIFSFNSSFGFNLSKANTKFRLNGELGGGALNDLGCYGISASQMILQESPILINSILTLDQKSKVDVSGIITILFEREKLAIIEFSFRSTYQSNYKIWGNKGILALPRAYNVKKQMKTIVELTTDVGRREIKIKPSDQFKNTFENFVQSVRKNNTYFQNDFLNQAKIMEACRISYKKKKPIYFHDIK